MPAYMSVNMFARNYFKKISVKNDTVKISKKDPDYKPKRKAYI